MSKPQNWPQTIFETPDEWGDTTYAEREEMLLIIENLKLLGEDWQDIELSDCREFRLVKGVGDKAIYEVIHTRHPEYILLDETMKAKFSNSIEELEEELESAA